MLPRWHFSSLIPLSHTTISTRTRPSSGPCRRRRGGRSGSWCWPCGTGGA
uniref:Uncharacterized protein n=1 Tax=Arundo donax TaxID=35708 RepID=A0A0A9C4G0_ARUDO